MGFSKQRVSLLLDELLSSYVYVLIICDNNLATIRKNGSTVTTVRHENSNHLARIVVLLEMLKLTKTD